MEKSDFSEDLRFAPTDNFASLRSQKYTVGVFSSISKSFSIVFQNAGYFIGFGILGFIAYMMSSIVGFIPIIGFFIPPLVMMLWTAGFMGGAYLQERNRLNSFSGLFMPFRQSGSLIFYQLLLSGVAFLLMVIAMIPLGFIGLLTSGGSVTERLEYIEEIAGTLENLDSVIAVGVFGFMLILYSVIIMLTLVVPLILFAKMSPFRAMQVSVSLVGRKFFSFLGWWFLWGVILFLSAIPLGLGLLITYPAFHISTYCIYSNLATQAGAESGGKAFFGEEGSPLDF